MKEKLIFLDIDGVLNNKQDGSSYYCLNPKSYGISINNLNNIKYLISITNAKIVLSTNWRNHEYNFEYLYNGKYFKSPLLKLNYELSDNFFQYESCPHIHGCNKRDDILGFFYYTKFDPADFNYIILDDATNQGLEYFKKRFFCIDVETGFTKSNAENAALFLNYNE